MEEWKEYKLGEICNIFTGKKDVNQTTPNGDYPFFSCAPTPYKSLEYIYDGNAIIVAGNGSFTGRVSFYKGKFDLYQRTYACTPIVDNVIFDYLYYYMKAFFEPKYMGGTRGSSIPYIVRGDLSNFLITIPPYAEQKNIASILKSLDDKIEVNRKTNENLEQEAQALFKSWFVDFEPFKNGEFVESELGRIPKGLDVQYISEISHILETGRRPKGGVGNLASGIPSVGAEHVKGMGNYDYSKTKFISQDYANTLKTGRVKGYELLIYKDGGKPGYFIPNYSIFGEGYPFEECYLNEHVFKLDFSDRGYNIFCYFFFKTDYVMNYLNAQGGKAAIPGINRKDIENILIFTPKNMQVQKFGELTGPIFKKILINCKESRRLAELRDILLPKLMSGELKVNEIENSL